MATTVTAAVAAMRRLLDEPTASQWTDEDIRRYLNEGIRDIGRRTRLHTDTNTIDVTADDGEYTLDSDILAIEHLLWKADADSDKHLLEARGFKTLAPYINESASDPYFYTTYGHPPVLKITLYPTPNRDGTLYVYGPVLPSLDVSGGTGNVDVAEAWLEAAYDYAAYMCHRKDKDMEAMQYSFAAYMDKVNSMLESPNTDDGMGEFTFTGSSMVPRWISDFD